MKKKIKSPIILIFYNRPKKTKKLLNLIRKVNFSKIYIKVDDIKILKIKKMLIQFVTKYLNLKKNIKIKLKLKKRLKTQDFKKIF